MAFIAPDDEVQAPVTKEQPAGGFVAPDEDRKTAIPDMVKDDEFEPLGYALETGDIDTAKEVAWQKRNNPMTASRFGGLVKKFGGATVDMIRDFGGGLGAVAIDSAEALSTPDAPFWQKQGIDPDTAKTIIERAKTQNLLRAQLAEEHGRGFMGKIFGANGFLGPAIRKLDKWSAMASPDVEAPAAQAANEAANAEELDRQNNPRKYFDAKFDEALAHATKLKAIEQGQIQQDDLISQGLKGLDYVAQRATGAAPGDITPALHFTDPAELAKEGAPIDPEAIQTGAVAIDPINLAPLHVPGAGTVFNKVAGAGLRTAAAPFRGAAWLAEHIPVVAKKTGTSTLGKYGLAGAVLHNPLMAAKGAASYVGTRVIGHVLDTAGQKLMNPKFVSAAEKAAAEEVMKTGKRGFLSGKQNLADAERMAGRVVGGAAAAPVAMAPLNYAISDTPEEFAATEGGVTGFGGLAGGLGYHPGKGFRPETIQAVDSILREKGAAKKYGTDLDASHDAFMKNAPDWVKDGVNAYRGFFDGFKFADGTQPEIYVLPRDQFAAEAVKHDPTLTEELAGRQRGFKSGEGKVVINGDYGAGAGTEAPSVLGHEAGGHVTQSIIQLLAPELDAAINKAATRNLLRDAGTPNERPTAKLQRFIDGYNKAFDPTGQHIEIKNNAHAISEFLAEQGRQAMEGGGPAKFAAGKALRETLQDNISDYFRKLFGTKQKFDRSEAPTLAREYRNMLFELGRLRGQHPDPAVQQQAAAPGQPPAGPAAAPEVPLAQAPGGANERGAVHAALQSLGYPSKVALQMAAAAQGATIEEMVKDALARKQTTPLTPPSAPTPQTAPQNAPTGQLGGFVAPAGEVAAVAAPVKNALSDFTPNETPTTPSANLPTSGTPVPPGNGLAGFQTPGVEPVSAVSPDDITGALIQAEKDAQPAADRARSGAKKAAIVRQARVDALSKMLPEDAEGLRPVTNPDTGEVTFRGEVDPANPVHAAILNEFGYTPEHIANITALQAGSGKGVYLRDYHAAQQVGHETGEGLELTGEQRGKEYAASPTGDVGQRHGAVTKQDKAFTPYSTVLTNKGVLIQGFDHDKFLGNLRSIIDAKNGLGDKKVSYSDKEIADAFRKVAENHANGWKGDGSDQLQTFPDTGIEQNLDYVGQPVDKDLADIINMAMNIRPTAAGAKEAQGLAQLNKGFLNPETGETNALRDQLEANGFDTGKELKPTISNVRPDLIEGGIHDTPTHGRNVHAHGFDIPPADLTTSGTPHAKQTSAGFMPGDSPKNREEAKSDSSIFWHGSPSGDFRGGSTGFHVGTFRAAQEALNARIGTPVEGEWDGTREYGKTLLKGRDSFSEKDGDYATGYSSDAPKEDHYPTGQAKYSGGGAIPMDAKPEIRPFKITGEMSNSKDRPHADFAANGRMKSAIKKGSAKRGYFYKNEGEDAGSISAVLPSGEHVSAVEYPTENGASFMPGEGELTDFTTPESESSIESKVTNSPEFKNWFGDSKVVDKSGEPIVLHHAGYFDETENGVPVIGDQGFHFGTKEAAQDRQGAKGVDDFIKNMEVTEHEGRWYWQSDNIDSFDINEDGFDTEAEARRDGEQAAIDYADNDYDSEQMPVTQAYLSIQNPMRTSDHKDDWSGVIQKAKEKGHDGIVYRNEFEDKGSQSYIAFEPSQIKSVNNEGTFDPKNPDVNFMPGEKENDRSREVLEEAHEMSTLPSITSGPISLSSLSGDWHINAKIGHAMVEWVHAFRKDPSPRTEAAYKLWGDAVADFAASLPDRQSKDARSGKLGDPFQRVKEKFPDGSKKDLADSIRSMYDLAKDGIGKNAMANMVARDYLNLVELIDMEGIAEMTPKLEKLYNDLNEVAYGSKKRTNEVLSDFAAEEEGGNMLGESEKTEVPGIGVQYRNNEGFMPGGSKQLEMFDTKDVESEKPSRWKSDSYEKAGDTVDGREVINADNIPNQGSIGAELGDNYKILPGVREVPMSDFTGLNGKHYSTQGQKRIDDLAAEIKESKQITPLIVAEDAEGPYVLEGATRAEALFKLGAKSFPALVVQDTTHGGAHFMPGEVGGKPLEDFRPAQDKLGFYSGLAQTIDKKIPARASGDQILATLKGAGAKQEEMDSMGLQEFLKSRSGPVTKQELQDFVKQGGIQLQEVTKGNTETWSADDEARLSELEQMGHRRTDADDEEYQALITRENSFLDQEAAHGTSQGMMPKFQQYTLPGGENYKEVLLTLPQKLPDLPKGWKVKPPDAGQTRWRVFDESGKMVAADKTEELVRRHAAEEMSNPIKMGQAALPEQSFRSSHWDEPNVLAHIRQADHTDTDGNKVRLIEEIQSDWHQLGRKKGYKGEEASGALDRNLQIDKELNAIAKRAFPDSTIHPFDIAGILERNAQMGIETGIPKDEMATAAARARELTTEWNEQVHPAMKFDSVPDAPFKKTWQELAFKRALRLAVNDGMDKIAWVTGDQQAERYDLSKQISKVSFAPKKFGDYSIGTLFAYDHNGKQVMMERDVEPSQFEDYIGKDPAKNLARELENKEDDTRQWTVDFDEDEGGWVIHDPNGEVIHDSGGSVLVSTSELAAKNEIEHLLRDEDDPTISGLDLKVGGEGMKGFYDKILPDFVRKYVKKWGGKVETTKLANTGQGAVSGIDVMNDMGMPHQAQDAYWRSLDEDQRSELMNKYRKKHDGKEVHSVTITPEMREAIKSGQPMFMPGDQEGGQLAGFGKEDMERHADKAGSVYQGQQQGLHAFRELSTGGNYSLKNEDATPENIQSGADKVRESFKGGETVTEDNIDDWLKANGFTGNESSIKSKVANSDQPLTQFMPGEEGDKRPEDVMSKPQMEDALQRLWNAHLRDYYDDPEAKDDPKNWREWVDQNDSYAIALALDSDSEFHDRYLSKFPEGISANDLVDAYKEGKLPDRIAPTPKRPRLPLSDVDFEPAGRVGEPAKAAVSQPEELASLWATAKQRPTKKTKDAINEARKQLLIQAHTQDITTDLGITSADLNKALRSWSAYPAEARRTHAQLNAGVPEVSHWNGIPNSSFINKASVKPEDVEAMVKAIDAPEGDSWYKPTAESVRRHLARFFMAIDTRIDFGDLTVKVELDPESYRAKTVRGDYSSHTQTVRLKENSPYTVAHELGHYLDNKWAREIGVNQYLSDSSFNRDIAKDKTSPERIEWAERFMEFVQGLSDKSDIHSEYTQSRKEVFARFVDKFAQWTNKQAGLKFERADNERNDRFGEGDYRDFVRLLQEKAFVDAKDGNPLGIKRSNPATPPEGNFMPGNGEPKRTWFIRGGKRVYHQRGDAGKFVPKLTLAGADFPDIQRKDEKQLAEFAP
jgi:hypothetical protein